MVIYLRDVYRIIFEKMMPVFILLMSLEFYPDIKNFVF